MKPAKHIILPENCTGCGLCANVCSKEAIRMVWNNEGFIVPQVNTEVCINCGLCVKMCPAQPDAMATEQYHDEVDAVVAYGGWNADTKTQQQSSSGGVFSELAEQIFARGGCVFGVGWKDKETAVFTKAENMEQITPMRGSKYVQAVPGAVYREVKAELKTGRQVLFSGTACQAYALKKYLRKPYDNLLTFDIVCHGVPSRKLLQAYVKHFELEQGKELKEVCFRFKDGNWQGYKVQKRFVDGTVLNHVNSQDMFMNLFIGDKMLNKACYNCPHAHFPRPGDMTLGDYWGNLKAMHPEWPIGDGIGSLVANSKKGKAILEKLADDGKISLHREPFRNLYNGQPRSYLRGEDSHIPISRDEALSRIGNEPLIDVWMRYCNTTKVGPLRLQTNGIIYKTLIFPRRVAGYIKRKIFPSL